MDICYIVYDIIWLTRHYSEIDEAILYKMPWYFPTFYVLCVKSKGQIYQFGLDPTLFWKGELPFPVKREKASSDYLNVVNIIRIIFFGLSVSFILIEIYIAFF